MNSEQYRFKKMLEWLGSKSGHGTELISLYIPFTTPISRVLSNLKNELSQASNIKSNTTRLSVQKSLESLISRLPHTTIEKNGIAIFCGITDAGSNKTNFEFYIVNAPFEISKYIYHCNSLFFLEPLYEYLEDKKSYGIIILDKREASIAILQGTKLSILGHLESRVPGKTERGGWSQKRYERIRQKALIEFYKKVGELSDSLLNYRLDGILLGGHIPAKDEIVDSKYLDPKLLSIILTNKSISYPNEDGIRELLELSKDVMENSELKIYKDLLSNFMTKISIGDKMVVYGFNQIKDALEKGQVDTLILSEEIIDYEFYLEQANKFATKVIFIPNNFEEGTQFYRAFKGIAGFLRYDQ